MAKHNPPNEWGDEKNAFSLGFHTFHGYDDTSTQGSVESREKTFQYVVAEDIFGTGVFEPQPGVLLPEAFLHFPNWTNYKPGEKILLNPRNLEKAKVNDPDTWEWFQESWKNTSQGYQVGFVIMPPFVFVDFDHCIENGKIQDPRIVNFLKWMDVVAEISQSKTGIHAFALWKGEPINIKTKILEVYTSKRFVALTGRVEELEHILGEEKRTLGEITLEDIKAWFPEVADHKIIIPAPQLSRDSETDPADFQVDFSIVEKIVRLVAQRAPDLWVGDWSAYPSQSEADLALMNSIVATWKRETGRIPTFREAVAVFHRSELGKREKAHRQDYLERTYSKALEVLEKADKEDDKDGEVMLDKRLKVVGRTKGRDPQIVIWDSKTKSLTILPSTFTKYQWRLIGGSLDTDDWGKLKLQIIEEASKNIVDPDQKIHSGIYANKEKIVIVQNGFVYDGTGWDEKVIWNGAFIEPDGRIIVSEPVDPIGAPQRLLEIIEKVWMTDEKLLLAGAIGISPFFTAFPWKPTFAIHGDRGRGKTALLNFLADLYPGLVIFTSDISVAGLVATAKHAPRILAIDEFERLTDRTSFVQFLKNLNYERTKYIRATKNGEEKIVDLQVLVWLASITIESSDSADRSRKLRFKLYGINPGYLPSHEETKQLGSDIIWAGIKNWETIIQKHNEWREEVKDQQVEKRAIDNLSLIVGWIRTFIQPDYTPPVEFYKLKEIDDSTQLLIDILTSKLPQRDYDIRTVADAIREHKNEILQMVGLKVIESEEDEPVVVFYTPKLKTELLKGTKWATNQWNLDDLLSNMGAKQKRVRFGGQRVYLPALPLKKVIGEEE